MSCNWDYANEIVEREKISFFDIVDSFAIKGTSLFLLFRDIFLEISSMYIHTDTIV